MITYDGYTDGDRKKNVEIIAHFASKEALQKIEKVGGKINLTKK